MRWISILAVLFVSSISFAGNDCSGGALGDDRLYNQEAFSNHGIPDEALQYAFDYVNKNAKLVTNKHYITIVNFLQASTEKRMYVLDRTTGTINTYYIAHGKNSGLNFVTSVSNVVNSNQSSAGIYITAEKYVGEHGLSMRLDGMESTNSAARERQIVFHTADYVSEETIKALGRLGRSAGCLVVEKAEIDGLLKQLGDGSVIYVYWKPKAGPENTQEIGPDLAPVVATY